MSNFKTEVNSYRKGEGERERERSEAESHLEMIADKFEKRNKRRSKKIEREGGREKNMFSK